MVNPTVFQQKVCSGGPGFESECCQKIFQRGKIVGAARVASARARRVVSSARCGVTTVWWGGSTTVAQSGALIEEAQRTGAGQPEGRMAQQVDDLVSPSDRKGE